MERYPEGQRAKSLQPRVGPDATYQALPRFALPCSRQIGDASAASLITFIQDAVEPSSVFHTDGWLEYEPLEKKGYDIPSRSFAVTRSLRPN
jgi:hypothetical protein